MLQQLGTRGEVRADQESEYSEDPMEEQMREQVIDAGTPLAEVGHPILRKSMAEHLLQRVSIFWVEAWVSPNSVQLSLVLM